MRGGLSAGPGCNPAPRRCGARPRRPPGTRRSNAAAPALKTLHTHLRQRAGLLVIARGLAVQTAGVNGRVLRGGEQDPLISQEGVLKGLLGGPEK